MARARKVHTVRKLVSGYLERIHSDVFSEFPDELTELVSGEHGVYALYKGNRLYYVGLARNLRRRIRNHLKNRHEGKWDRFSLYLVRQVDHIRELESLHLRIASPVGNVTGGRLQQADDLSSVLKSEIRTAQERVLTELMRPDRKARRKLRTIRKRIGTHISGEKGLPELKPFIKGRMTLRGKSRGKTYRAHVRKSGRINFAGKLYDSPSSAAKAALGYPVNGWRFWRCQETVGHWVGLYTFREKSARKR